MARALTPGTFTADPAQEPSDALLLAVALVSADVLGRSRELADAAAELFLARPLPSARIIQRAPIEFTEVCAYASPKVARRCFARYRAIVGADLQGSSESWEQMVRAAERFSEGDYAGAVAAWRPLLGGDAMTQFIAIAFDRVGEPEIASRLDDRLIDEAAFPTTAHLREARRAAARKDLTRCAELARALVDSWSVADVKVPALDEARTLLAKCAAKPTP